MDAGEHSSQRGGGPRSARLWWHLRLRYGQFTFFQWLGCRRIIPIHLPTPSVSPSLPSLPPSLPSLPLFLSPSLSSSLPSFLPLSLPLSLPPSLPLFTRMKTAMMMNTIVMKKVVLRAREGEQERRSVCLSICLSVWPSEQPRPCYSHRMCYRLFHRALTRHERKGTYGEERGSWFYSAYLYLFPVLVVLPLRTEKSYSTSTTSSAIMELL